MSLSECKRFAEDLRSNEALRAEAEKAEVAGMAMDAVVAFAASKGYAVTADDLKEYAKAKTLTDKDLGGIVGGATNYTITIENTSGRGLFPEFDRKPPPI